MSGHSHSSNIKNRKQTADAKKSKLFSKLINEIRSCAKNGKDPETNYKLRSVVQKAKDANMSSDKIERAILAG
jgi:transcriptional/translational regulatory protein YebC/TACO1